MALSEMRWHLIAMGVAYAAMIGVYAGLPLGDGGGLQTEPPIFSTGYDDETKSFIFLMQGLATLLPWVLDIKATKTAVFVTPIWWLWICTWATESCWTVIQYIMQSKYPGEMPVAGLSLALLAVLFGHVFMSLAIRRLVLAYRTKMFEAIDDTSIPVGPIAWAGVMLYIIPSAIYAGWLGLASCLCVIQLAGAAGASYDALTTASIVLLTTTGLTALFQPWILRPGLFCFFPHGAQHICTQLKDQQQRHTVIRKLRLLFASWGAFWLANHSYGYTIWWALADHPEEHRPQALRRAWVCLLVAFNPFFMAMAFVGRLHLDRRFPPQNVLDAVCKAGKPGIKNVVLYVQDENTSLLHSEPPTNVSASCC